MKLMQTTRQFFTLKKLILKNTGVSRILSEECINLSSLLEPKFLSKLPFEKLGLFLLFVDMNLTLRPWS